MGDSKPACVEPLGRCTVHIAASPTIFETASSGTTYIQQDFRHRLASLWQEESPGKGSVFVISQSLSRFSLSVLVFGLLSLRISLSVPLSGLAPFGPLSLSVSRRSVSRFTKKRKKKRNQFPDTQSQGCSNQSLGGWDSCHRSSDWWQGLYLRFTADFCGFTISPT